MSSKKQENQASNDLLKTIKEWVKTNKKVFWRYEVSCFYKTYVLSIANLPEPEESDIQVVHNKKLLNDEQKKDLCKTIVKACKKMVSLTESKITVQIDYAEEKGVIAAVK